MKKKLTGGKLFLPDEEACKEALHYLRILQSYSVFQPEIRNSIATAMECLKFRLVVAKHTKLVQKGLREKRKLEGKVK